jgi:hypothetical protein
MNEVRGQVCFLEKYLFGYNSNETNRKVKMSLTVDISDNPVFSTNKNDRHDITEILLKVVLNTVTY